METKGSYGITADPRSETLCGKPDWAAPNPDELRAVLKMAGWTGEEFSRRIGVDSRTVRRWTLGEKPIAYTAWCILCVQAGLGNIWLHKPLGTPRSD